MGSARRVSFVVARSRVRRGAGRRRAAGRERRRPASANERHRRVADLELRRRAFDPGEVEVVAGDPSEDFVEQYPTRESRGVRADAYVHPVAEHERACVVRRVPRRHRGGGADVGLAGRAHRSARAAEPAADRPSVACPQRGASVHGDADHRQRRPRTARRGVRGRRPVQPISDLVDTSYRWTDASTMPRVGSCSRNEST